MQAQFRQTSDPCRLGRKGALMFVIHGSNCGAAQRPQDPYPRIVVRRDRCTPSPGGSQQPPDSSRR